MRKTKTRHFVFFEFMQLKALTTNIIVLGGDGFRVK